MLRVSEVEALDHISKREKQKFVRFEIPGLEACVKVLTALMEKYAHSKDPHTGQKLLTEEVHRVHMNCSEHAREGWISDPSGKGCIFVILLYLFIYGMEA